MDCRCIFILENIYDKITIKKYEKKLEKVKSLAAKSLNIDDFANYKVEEKLAIVINEIQKMYGIAAYDEQIIAALLMIDGYIIEMKTGEGKTLTGVIVSIIKGFNSKVYLVTVNSYLAKRDYEKFKPLFDKFKIDSANNEELSENNEVDKIKIHNANVIYTSTTELIFDYLRTRDDKSIVSFNNVIIDEIDFVFIDNATSVCSVSNEAGDSLNNEEKTNFEIGYEISKILQGYEVKKGENKFEIYNFYDCDYVYNKRERSISITEKGLKKLFEIFNIDHLYENTRLYAAIMYSLEAKEFYKRDRDYFVLENKICIINQYNGRAMKNSKFATGIQNAIEMKENVDLTKVNIRENSISYQYFFALFEFVTGMSGTAYLAKEEFEKVLSKDTIKVPLHKKNLRKDQKTLIYKTKSEKYKGIYNKIVEFNDLGQPILVVTESANEAFLIKKLLDSKKLNCNILTNHNTDAEEEIVKSAGKSSVITISTNLVGRGTDIIIEDKLKNKDGLVVICLNRYSSDRVDEQVRGRAGRQGEPGVTVFASSLEDHIFKYMENNEYIKIMNLEEDKFYCKNNQEILNKKIKYYQNIISSDEKTSRKYNLLFDKETEGLRTSIFNESIKIKNIDEFIKSNMCEKLIEKIEYVGGEDKAKIILNKIFSEILKQMWYDIDIEIKFLREDIHRIEKREDMLIGRFSIELNKSLENRTSIIMELLLENFYTVNLA